MTRVSRLTFAPRATALALAVALLGALFAMSAWMAAPVRAADVAVGISDFAFSPPSLTIQVGDTVTWTNGEVDVQHTVTSDDGAPAAFDSGSLAPGDTFSFTFDTAGTYTYHCSIHSTMTATIVVEAAAAPTPAPSLPNGAVAPDGSGSMSVQGWSLAIGLLLMSLGGIWLVLVRRRAA